MYPVFPIVAPMHVTKTEYMGRILPFLYPFSETVSSETHTSNPASKSVGL